MRLLLSSVREPFAVEDLYGCGEYRKAPFLNQSTQEQGITSYRFNHGSFGLHLMPKTSKCQHLCLSDAFDVRDERCP